MAIGNRVLIAVTVASAAAMTACSVSEPPVATGQAANAVAEFRNILARRGLSVASVAYPIAQLGLARALAAQHDTANARTAYQDFLALWKEADLDIPILKEAKAEYAKLQ